MMRGWMEAGLVALAVMAGPGSAPAGGPLLDLQTMPRHEDLAVISVTATAATEAGPLDPAPLARVVSERLREIGFIVDAGPERGRAVVVRVQCGHGEGRAMEESAAGSQAPGRTRVAPTGPPCEVTYLHRGRVMAWRRLDRVAFDYGVEAARRVGAGGSALSPMEWFVRYLSILDFPVLLAAEWAQVDRLRRLLESPGSDLARKRRVIALLGEIRARDAFACLVQALDHEALAREAALSLGQFGHEAREPLVRLLRSSPSPPVQAAAARSLGRIGARTGDWSLSTLFIETLRGPELALEVQVELVWALGYNPDRRALPVLEELYERAWRMRAEDPRLDELRKAIDFSHRAIRLGGHADQY